MDFGGQHYKNNNGDSYKNANESSLSLHNIKVTLNRFWNRSLSNKLIFIHVLIYLGQIFGAIPYRIFALKTPFSLELSLLPQLFTYGMLHGGLLHLALNMLGLYFVGNSVERFTDKKTFFSIYFGGFAIGGLLWLLINNGNLAVLVGASAGLCALLSYFCILNRSTLIELRLFYFIPARMYAWTLYVIIFALTLAGLFYFEIPAAKSGTLQLQTIAHSAHMGGLLLGAGIARLAEFRRNHRYGNVKYFNRKF